MDEILTPEEEIRDAAALDKIVTDAVIEVVQVFGSEMTERDKEILLSVEREVLSTPQDRVLFIQETLTRSGVSEKYSYFVSQIMETLRKQLTPAELDGFKEVLGSGASTGT